MSDVNVATRRIPKRGKLVHRGLHHNRTLVNDFGGRLEAAFAEVWEEENIVKRRTMYTECSLLAVLLSENDKIPFVTQDQASVAATIIQWLGTSVGIAFLKKSLQKVDLTLDTLKKSSTF